MNIPRQLLKQAATVAVCLVFLVSTRPALAQSGPPALPPYPFLDSYSFLQTNLYSDFGYAPIGYSNAFSIPEWGGSALWLDTSNEVPAYVHYNIVETNGHVNIDLAAGVVFAIVIPDWASADTNQYGYGPGALGYLLAAGDFSSGSPAGLWAVYVNAGGTNIYFGGVSNSVATTYLSAPISWATNSIHLIGLYYYGTNSALYLDGQAAATGGPVTVVPETNTWTNGFYIGSAESGYSEFRGVFWYVELDTTNISSEFGTNYINDAWGSITNGYYTWLEPLGGEGGFHPADGWGAGFSLPPTPTNTYNTNYAAYTNFWMSITNNGGVAQVSLINPCLGLTYEILTNADLSSTHWQPWVTIVGSNTVTTAPPLEISTNNALFFNATLVWSTTNSGLPDWWLMYYFNRLNISSNADLDGSGASVLYDYQNGIDPNVIGFNLTATNQFVSSGSVPMQTTVTAGIPSYMATLVDSTNYAGASWLPYNSNMTVSVGTNQGWHQIWVGLRGLPPTAQQTWAWYRVKLDTTPPLLVITNPSSSTVMQPMIEVQGYCPEALASLSYDLSNATGLITNQPAFVLNQNYTTNTWEFTTNTFQAFDVPLTNGANTFTFHATDLAGNVTTTNFTYTLSYAGRTNPPVVQFYWPQNGTQISGNSFTARGSLDDFTTSLQATIVDTNGDTNTITAIIERNGNFWIENLPLALGSNELTLTATDVASNVTTTNITVIGSSLTLTMTAVETNQLWQMTENVSGTISDASGYSVWVNGVEATNGSGTWGATNVPVITGGTAAFQVRAIADSDNGGNGSGGGTATLSNLGNPTSATAIDVETSVDKPSRLYGSQYIMNLSEIQYEATTNISTPGNPGNNDVDLSVESDLASAIWSDGAGGSGSNFTTVGSLGDGESGQTNTSLVEWTWPTSYWSNSVSGMETTLYGVQTWPGWTYYGPSTFPIDTVVSFAEESCDVDFPTNFTEIGASWNSTYVRTAQLGMQLYSGGGKGVPGAQNIFRITCPMMDMLSTNPILPQNISIGVLGNLDSSSNLYVSVPSGTTVVATPSTRDRQDYTFGPNAPQIPVTLTANGYDLSQTNPTFCVGQQITFSVTFPGLAASNVYCNWTLSGNVVNSSSSNASTLCVTYTNDNSLFSGPTNSYQCWYYNGPSGKVSVGVNLIVNGKSISTAAVGQFAIYRPTFTFNDEPPSWVTNAMVDGTLSLSLGDGTSGDMEFQIVVNTAYPGWAGIAQLANINRTSGNGLYSTTTTGGGYWLDKNFPYGGAPGRLIRTNVPPLQFADGPNIALITPTTTAYDQFEDYIVFAPTNAGSIYVTLGTLGLPSWSWNGSTSYSTSNSTWSSAAGFVTRPSVQDNSAAFPQWTNVFH